MYNILTTITIGFAHEMALIHQNQLIQRDLGHYHIPIGPTAVGIVFLFNVKKISGLAV